MFLFEKAFSSLDVTGLLMVAIFFIVLELVRPSLMRFHGCDKEARSIPGPLALPVLGTSWLFFLPRYSFNRLHEIYDEMMERYGVVVKEEVFGNIPVIHLFDRGDIEKVFRSGGKYPLRPPTEAVAYYRRSRPDRYATLGLINEQGEKWRTLRSALTPVLTSPNTITAFLPQVDTIADDWCHLVKQSRHKSSMKISNLEDIVDRLSLEVTCALVLGRRMGLLLLDGETGPARKLSRAVRRHFLATRDTYFGLPLWKFIPTAAYKQLVQCEEEIYKLALDLIETADDSIRDSLVFQSVLKADIDDREKTAAIVDFIAAGIHTMKNSLIFLLHLIGSDYKIQERILQDSSGAYLRACLTESFRMYPTANSLARILEEPLVVCGGYKLPAGTVVICHTGTVCRDAKNFKLPNEFHPERWLQDSGEFHANNAGFLVTPFGVGRRICPGKRFIEHVVPRIVEHTVRNFEIQSLGPLELQFEFLLTPKTPVAMAFKDRNL